MQNSRLTQILFVAIVCIFLCAPLGYRFADALPTSINVPTESQLEARNYTTLDDLQCLSFLEGDFQSSFESYVADGIPNRSEAVLITPYIQYNIISLAAKPFGYRWLKPTFNSAYIADTANRLFYPPPEKTLNNLKTKRFNALVGTINAIAEENPSISVIWDVVQKTSQSELNPQYSKVSNASKYINSGYIKEHLTGISPSVNVMFDPVESLEEIRSEWYATDHHWTLKRGVKSYNRIAETLGLNHFEYDSESPTEMISQWHGTYARAARNLEYSDKIEDTLTDYSDFTFYSIDSNGEKGDVCESGHREMLLSGSITVNDAPIFDTYNWYYGNHSVLIENAGDNNGKTCIFVGDSYSFCLHRLVADNYKTTIYLLPGNDSINCSLKSLVSKYDSQYGVNDLIILAHATKSTGIGKLSPQFIGL